MLSSGFRDINIKEIVEMIIELAIQIMNLKKMAVEFSIFFFKFFMISIIFGCYILELHCVVLF